MSLPRYPKYRASGVEWLGDVPAHWSIQRLKRVCIAFPSNVDKKSYDGEQPVGLCNYTDVYYNDLITSALEFMPATASAEQVSKFTLRAGDTIITKDSETADDIGVSAYVPADLPAIVCGYHLSIIRPRPGACGAFVKWVFDSRYCEACLAVRANGLTRVGLSQADIDNLEWPWPPIDEQLAIAGFLDREVAKIDGLVAEQQRLIELLNEKRQAVISRTVTRGLDPNALMKPSGVEWSPVVPEHWEVGPLKRFWSVTDCKHITAEFVDDGIPVASIREVQSRWVELSGARQTTADYYEQLVDGGRLPEAGDLIFSRNATVGEVAQVRADHPRFAMGQDVVLLKKVRSQSSSDYLQFVLRSPIVMDQIAILVIGSTFKRINVEEIRQLVVPFPPADEQKMIATALERTCAGLNALLAECRRGIAILGERRAGLISAAVTGEIDVRSEACGHSL